MAGKNGNSTNLFAIVIATAKRQEKCLSVKGMLATKFAFLAYLEGDKIVFLLASNCLPDLMVSEMPWFLMI